MKKRFLIYQVVVPVLILFLITDCKKEEPAKLAVVSTTTVTNITQTTASAGGTVTDNGGAEITDIGVCWNTSPNPTISSNKASIGIITGLTANTTYYLRAYATNRAGTSYGNEVTFKTDNIIIATTGPILTTTAVTSITFTSAVSGGTITNDGGEDIAYRGVCWSTSQFHLPTIEDTKTTDGTTMGYFTSNLMGLDPGTTYFIRAYATNSSGTVYGNLLSFTTSFTQGPGQGLWIQKVNLPGGVRYSAASFSIGTKGYIGIGYNDGDWPRRDFWEWDQVTNIWTRLADYPGNSTGIAVCFSIGAKGYIGTGNDFMTLVLQMNFGNMILGLIPGLGKHLFPPHQQEPWLWVFLLAPKDILELETRIHSQMETCSGITRIFGNGTRQLMFGQRKPTFLEIHEQELSVFQSETKDT